MHPLGTRALEPSGRLDGSGLLTNTIGNPLETTIALSHLIFEGTLDRFPGLKICAAHGGGFLPSYANRSDAVIRCFPNRVGPLPKKKPTAYLKDGQLFFDTIVFTPEALRHLIAETGPGQIMIGTDYPFPWTSTEVDLVLEHARPQRRAAHRHPGWHGGEAARHQVMLGARASGPHHDHERARGPRSAASVQAVEPHRPAGHDLALSLGRQALHPLLQHLRRAREEAVAVGVVGRP